MSDGPAGNWTATPPTVEGNYHWREREGSPVLILAVYRTADGHLAARDFHGLFGRLNEWVGEWWSAPIQEPPA
jgi:hypothetical protein